MYKDKVSQPGNLSSYMLIPVRCISSSSSWSLSGSIYLCCSSLITARVDARFLPANFMPQSSIASVLCVSTENSMIVIANRAQWREVSWCGGPPILEECFLERPARYTDLPPGIQNNIGFVDTIEYYEDDSGPIIFA